MRVTVGMERREAGVMVTEERWNGAKDSVNTNIYNTRHDSTRLSISGRGFKGTY